MHGENLLVDDGRDGQAVEAVRERLPELDVVSALACLSGWGWGGEVGERR